MSEAVAALGDLHGGSTLSRMLVSVRTLGVATRFLVARPRLWGWALAPLGIIVALALMAGLASFAGIGPLLAWLTHFRGMWGKALVWVTALLVGLAVTAITAFVLYFLVNIIAVPFYDGLSERVEHELTGKLQEPDWGTWLAALFWSAVHSALTLALWACILLFSFALQVVPGLGTVLGGVFGTVASAIFLARETMDGPMSRRDMPYLSKYRMILRHKAVLGGWGLLLAMLMWVPIVNVLMMPVAVVGGTILFCAFEASDRRS